MAELPPATPQTRVHKVPPVWHQILPFPAPTARSQYGAGERGRKGCSVPSVPTSCPCSIPIVSPTPVPAVLPLCAHLGLGSVPRGPWTSLSPSVSPWHGLNMSPAWPFPSPEGPAKREQSRAEGRGSQSPQAKLGSAQSQTGTSKASRAPGGAGNACPTQPRASGQTEQTKLNQTTHFTK